MATAETLSYYETEQLLAKWAASDGPTEEEKIQFIDAVLAQIHEESMVEEFLANVREVGTAANEIDEAFDRVTRAFNEMVAKYSKDLPKFIDYYDEWKGYYTRWIQYLNDSRDVASTHITILRRFDKVFLDMVESIRTDQDRLDCIVELQAFVDEDHTDSTETSRNFLILKRDIEHFVRRLDAFIVDKGVELAAEATKLKLEIDSLQSEIEVLDGQIYDATIALSVMGGLISIIGMVVAGSVLASYQDKRKDKIKQLHKKQAALADVNKKQDALANLKSEFDGVKPDIALICAKLSLFAGIWAQVQSQCVQFQEHLQGGFAATTNLRFKKEIRLAREVATPLAEGLAIYATELENNPNVKKRE